MAGKAVDNYKASLRLYEEDARTPCKYGSECYQKNPVHHETYKHPPKRKVPDFLVEDEEDDESPSKIAKPTEEEEPKSSDQDSDEEQESSEQESENITMPDDKKEAIKVAFLVEMPEDFYSFWAFCQMLKKDNPSGALKDAGLLLVGPFDIMAGKVKNDKYKQDDFFRHWRYYYDPPEFQTVIKGDDKQGFHIGYYRDEPSSLPCFVASNCAAVDGVITPVAENLFGAVNSCLESVKEKADPFRKVKINSLIKSLQSWAEKQKFTLETSTAAMKTRSRKVCAKTFHKAGIVVPIDKKKDTGYRPLIESNNDLKKILKNIADSDNDSQRLAFMEKLQPVMTAADIANDEGDFGNGLELGLDLFTFGGEVFHRRIEHLLCTAYSLLNREEFADILKAHLQDRKEGSNLSTITDE